MLRILLITPEFPFPAHDGVKIPVWNRILGLCNHCSLDVFISQSYDELSLEQKRIIHKLSNVNFIFENIFITRNIFFRTLIFIFTKLPFFATNKLNIKAISIISSKILNEKYSHVIIDTEKFARLIELLPKDPIYIISPNDSISLSYSDELKYRSPKGIISKIYTYINFRKATKYESKYYSKFHYCQLVSYIDSSYLQKLNKNIKTFLCPVGIKPKKLFNNYVFSNYPFILIVGRLAGGNLEYVEFFINNVWNKFNSIFPMYKLILVSRIVPHKFEKKYSRLNVEVHSAVDDVQLESFYLRSSFVISPVRKSSGMLNKVVEAMSFGKLVIGFNMSFYCLENSKNGIQYIGVYNAGEMLFEMIGAVEDKIKTKKIGNSAKLYVDNYLNWEFIIEDYIKFLEKTRLLY